MEDLGGLKMTNEKAIDIFERMLSHYQGELYTDSEREMKEALELGKQALQTGEIYMSAVDYNLFLEGYKQGKKDFERPQGEWVKKVDDVGFISYICSKCGFELELEDCSDSYYCPNCGADMRGKENGQNC